MKRSYYLVLLGCFCAVTAMAQDLSSYRKKKKPLVRPAGPVAKTSESTIKKYLFNVGSHTEFINNIQTDTSGGVRKFDLAPTLGGGLYMPMEGLFTFLPEVNWVLPRTDEERRIIKNLFLLRADFGYEPIEWFRLRVGSSLIWLNQIGRGGSAVINNGNDTSVFYYPEDSRSSLNNTLDVGAEALFGNWGTRLQTYTYSVFKRERRQHSYSLFLTYYWDR